MTLKELSEFLNNLLDSGADESTLIFVPIIEEEALVHVEADITLIDVSKDDQEAEKLGIVLYPYDADYYELEENEEDTTQANEK